MGDGGGRCTCRASSLIAHHLVGEALSENIAILLRGLIIGISISAPMGAIGVLCIRRRLSDGRLTGFVSGLEAATADMIYGAIAAFGLTNPYEPAYWSGQLA